MAGQSGPAAGLRANLERRLDRLLERPLIRKLDPVLGVSELRRVNPLIALVPIGVMVVLGARTSQFGHMDTVGGIFPVISLISTLNPFVGLLSGIGYAAADFIQKLIVDDVFYETIGSGGDFWTARLGYLLAYSSMVMFGLVPGILARIGSRIGERVATRAATQGATAAQPSPNAVRLGRVAGGAIGAAVGGLGSAIAYQATAAPAFLLRASPDHSCYVLSRSNVRAAIPAIMLASAGGGGGSALLDGIGSDADVGAKPEDQRDKDRKACNDLLTRFQQDSSKYATEREDAVKAIRALNGMYANLQRMEEARRNLIEEQQGAVGLMMAAGGLAAGVVSAIAATYCAAQAKALHTAASQAATLAEAAPSAMGMGSAFGESFWLQMNGQAARQALAWETQGARIGIGGVPGGIGMGAAAGKVLESMMDKGLAQFNESATALERTVFEMEETVKLKVHDPRRLYNDLRELQARIRTECRTDVSLPAQEPPSMPSRGHTGGGLSG